MHHNSFKHLAIPLIFAMLGGHKIPTEFTLTAFPLHAILFVPSRPQSDVSSIADCSGMYNTVRDGSSVSRHPRGPRAHDGTKKLVI